MCITNTLSLINIKQSNFVPYVKIIFFFNNFIVDYNENYEHEIIIILHAS